MLTRDTSEVLPVKSPATPGAAAEGRLSPRQKAPPQNQRPRGQARWPWTLINFWLDSLLLVVFLLLICVATIVQFIFPPATAAQNWLLWGYSLDQWMGFQFALMAIFAFGVLVHLMLHWSWVCGVFFSKLWRRKGKTGLPDDGTRTIYGVGLMIVILNALGLLIAAAALSIQSPL